MIMFYRNKTYVCFDADHDMHCYRMMQAWKENDRWEFNFYNAHDLTTIRQTSGEDAIKANLRERMKNSKNLVVLVGENIRHCHTYVRWEIEQAMRMNLPIIVANLNKSRRPDYVRCPKILRDQLAIHIPYSRLAMTYALDNWPASHASHVSAGNIGPRFYKDHVYNKIGLL